MKNVNSIFSMRYIPGLNIYCFNKDDKTLFIPVKEEVNVDVEKKIFSHMTKTREIRKAYPIAKNLIYIQALNIKNCIRKLSKSGYKENEIKCLI